MPGQQHLESIADRYLKGSLLDMSQLNDDSGSTALRLWKIVIETELTASVSSEAIAWQLESRFDAEVLLPVNFLLLNRALQASHLRSGFVQFLSEVIDQTENPERRAEAASILLHLECQNQKSERDPEESLLLESLLKQGSDLIQSIAVLLTADKQSPVSFDLKSQVYSALRVSLAQGFPLLVGWCLMRQAELLTQSSGVSAVAAMLDSAEGSAIGPYRRLRSEIENLRERISDYDRTSLVVDENRLTVETKLSCLEFAGQPMLFGALVQLISSQSYIGKESLSNNLWPHETYNPKSHDPRIQNLIQRLRKKLARDERCELGIQSNTLGYRLIRRGK